MLDHLEKSKFFRFLHDFGHCWPIFGHFGPILGPLLTLLGPKSPQNEGGTGQNAPKTGVNHPKMRFGAILDHLKVTFIHFGPF